MDRKEIAFTKSKAPYGWMGNMSRFPITYMGKTWGSTEHLFQAMRFGLESPFGEMVRREDNPYQSKQVAKTHREHMIIEPCSIFDLNNMEICLRLKLDFHQELKVELLGTGKGTPIYEDVTKRGEGGSNLFWGAMKMEDGSWKGENVVGHLWMKIRDEMFPDDKPVTELEIERRFLLKDIPLAKFEMKLDITQHYLSKKGDKETERVRATTTILLDEKGDEKDIIVNDKWVHTVKKPTGGLGQDETEWNMSWKEFKEYKVRSDRSISKARYVKEHTSDKLKWEIDSFARARLVIAEIEIPSEDYDLVIPEWLKPYVLLEITGMNQFSNSNLAQ